MKSMTQSLKQKTSSLIWPLSQSYHYLKITGQWMGLCFKHTVMQKVNHAYDRLDKKDEALKKKIPYLRFKQLIILYLHFAGLQLISPVSRLAISLCGGPAEWAEPLKVTLGLMLLASTLYIGGKIAFLACPWIKNLKQALAEREWLIEKEKLQLDRVSIRFFKKEEAFKPKRRHRL